MEPLPPQVVAEPLTDADRQVVEAAAADPSLPPTVMSDPVPRRSCPAGGNAWNEPAGPVDLMSTGLTEVAQRRSWRSVLRRLHCS
jgi:hypothetical protein